MKNRFLVPLFFALVSTPAFAAPGLFGLAVGVNYNEYAFGGTKIHGVGGSAAAIYSLFPSSPIGLRASLLGNYLQASGTGAKVSGFAPLVALTANYNYRAANKGRVSAGIGVGYDYQNGMSCTGTACPSFPSSSTGLVLEARADGGGSFFGMLQVYFPMDESRTTLKMTQGVLLGGLEFGSVK